jgi:hypothetical protein
MSIFMQHGWQVHDFGFTKSMKTQPWNSTAFCNFFTGKSQGLNEYSEQESKADNILNLKSMYIDGT